MFWIINSVYSLNQWISTINSVSYVCHEDSQLLTYRVLLPRSHWTRHCPFEPASAYLLACTQQRGPRSCHARCGFCGIIAAASLCSRWCASMGSSLAERVCWTTRLILQTSRSSFQTLQCPGAALILAFASLPVGPTLAASWNCFSGSVLASWPEPTLPARSSFSLALPKSHTRTPLSSQACLRCTVRALCAKLRVPPVDWCNAGTSYCGSSREWYASRRRLLSSDFCCLQRAKGQG